MTCVLLEANTLYEEILQVLSPLFSSETASHWNQYESGSWDRLSAMVRHSRCAVVKKASRDALIGQVQLILCSEANAGFYTTHLSRLGFEIIYVKFSPTIHTVSILSTRTGWR
jgi:hypothetical protein